MTRSQIKQLMSAKGLPGALPPAQKADDDEFSDDLPPLHPPQPHDAVEAPSTSDLPATAPTTYPAPVRPVLSPKISQTVLALRQPVPAEQLIYVPMLLAVAQVHFVQSRGTQSCDDEVALLVPIPKGPLGIAWDRADPIDAGNLNFDQELVPALRVDELPPSAADPRAYTQWRKELEDFLYRTRRVDLYQSESFGAVSSPGESERDFRIRLGDQFREERDDEVERLRKKYDGLIATAEERVRKAESRLERERQEASGATVQNAISFGATVLSALFGRKRISSRTIGSATSAARGVGRSARQHEDVKRASDDVEAFEDRLQTLERELEDEIANLTARLDPMSQELTTVQLKPRRTDINVRLFSLTWAPYVATPRGAIRPAF